MLGGFKQHYAALQCSAYISSSNIVYVYSAISSYSPQAFPSCSILQALIEQCSSLTPSTFVEYLGMSTMSAQWPSVCMGPPRWNKATCEAYAEEHSQDRGQQSLHQNASSRVAFVFVTVFGIAGNLICQWSTFDLVHDLLKWNLMTHTLKDYSRGLCDIRNSIGYRDEFCWEQFQPEYSLIILNGGSNLCHACWQCQMSLYVRFQNSWRKKIWSRRQTQGTQHHNHWNLLHRQGSDACSTVVSFADLSTRSWD